MMDSLNQVSQMAYEIGAWKKFWWLICIMKNSECPLWEFIESPQRAFEESLRGISKHAISMFSILPTVWFFGALAKNEHLKIKSRESRKTDQWMAYVSTSVTLRLHPALPLFITCCCVTFKPISRLTEPWSPRVECNGVCLCQHAQLVQMNAHFNCQCSSIKQLAQGLTGRMNKSSLLPNWCIFSACSLKSRGCI